MLDFAKNYVLDENQKAIAVQISIADFEKIEEILENYGLAKMMDEVATETTLNKEEALEYLKLMKEKNVDS